MTRGNVSVTPFREGSFSGVCLGVPPSFIMEQTALFDAGKTRLCKQGSKLTAALSKECFIKNYFYSGFLSRVRHLFRRSRAESCFYSALAVRRAKVPILIVHGKADTLVPYAMSEEIRDAAPEKVTLEGFDGAPHGLSFLTDREKYTAIVDRFWDHWS